MNLKIINPTQIPGWNESLLSLPGHSFFHTSSWAEVLHTAYGYRPLYFTYGNQDSMTALLPLMEVNSLITGKRGVSLPFTDYCEPIFSDAAQFQKMFSAAIDFAKKQNWKYTELRGGEAFFHDSKPSTYFYGHTLDLTPGLQRLFSNLRDSTRRNIIKAEKEDITITISTSPDSLKEFYRLNAITRRDHGLPPQPFKFFQSVFDRILSSNLGFIVTASFQNTAVAANMYFTFGDAVLYKYGASDRRYQHLRINNLVMWEAIKWSCHHGYKTLCFGRTERENEGLRQFKLGWGVRERLINYYRYNLRTDAFVAESTVVNPLYKKIFANLPIPVLNKLGDILYRHMG